MENIEDLSFSDNESKTKTLIAYIALKSDIGKTKLMKLLYLIDFTMYEKAKKSITNDEYQHWPYGPVPINIWNKIGTDYIDEFLSVNQIPHNNGTYFKFTPNDKNINLSGYFSDDEMDVIDEVLSKYGDKHQEELVSMVHNEFPYLITDEKETIPYFLACYRNYGDAEKSEQEKQITQNEDLMKNIKEKIKKHLQSYPIKSAIMCNEQ